MFFERGSKIYKLSLSNHIPIYQTLELTYFLLIVNNNFYNFQFTDAAANRNTLRTLALQIIPRMSVVRQEKLSDNKVLTFDRPAEEEKPEGQ